MLEPCWLRCAGFLFGSEYTKNFESRSRLCDSSAAVGAIRLADDVTSERIRSHVFVCDDISRRLTIGTANPIVSSHTLTRGAYEPLRSYLLSSRSHNGQTRHAVIRLTERTSAFQAVFLRCQPGKADFMRWVAAWDKADRIGWETSCDGQPGERLSVRKFWGFIDVSLGKADVRVLRNGRF